MKPTRRNPVAFYTIRCHHLPTQYFKECEIEKFRSVYVGLNGMFCHFKLRLGFR
jgi:hypothetical protein